MRWGRVRTTQLLWRARGREEGRRQVRTAGKRRAAAGPARLGVKTLLPAACVGWCVGESEEEEGGRAEGRGWKEGREGRGKTSRVLPAKSLVVMLLLLLLLHVLA